jgi:pimeloyl-ACP methyl ester carboxylesterase
MRPRIVGMAAAMSLAVVPIGVAPSTASAQKAIVMNHGVLSNGQTWDSATVRLQRRFGSTVQTFRPNREWTHRISPQVTDLLAELNSNGVSGRSPIVVGHSLGGVVSRGLVRSMNADAIITVGAPNQGHPLVANSWRLTEKYLLLSAAVAPIVYLANCGEPQLDWYTCRTLERFAERIIEFSAILAAGQALVYISSSFVEDLDPGSAFVDTLNSAVGHERVQERHNIVVQLSSGALGPIPMLYEDPQQAWAVFDRFTSAGYYMLEYGMDLISMGCCSFSNPLALGGAALIGAGWEMLTLGDTWSSALGGWPHDGFIPVSAQYYPGATVYNLIGPSHVQETRNTSVSQLIGDIARRYGAYPLDPCNGKPCW